MTMAAPLQFFNPQASQVLLLAQQVRAWERLAPAPREALQHTQLHQLCGHAHRHSPFWRLRLAQAGFDERRPDPSVLGRLPVLTRAELQHSFEAMRARWPGLDEADVAVSITSGSTGMPVRVEKARSFYAPLYAATAWIDTQWHQRDPSRKMAVLAFSPPSADSTSPSWGSMYESLGLRGQSLVRSLTGHSMDSHLDWLLAQQPDYLKCSPVAVAELAQLALARGVTLPLKQVISQSERVTSRQRTLCREAFGAPIIDRYSCEETGWLALQCPVHTHLHAMSASVWLEIVDELGQPCPPGQVGRVLVTSLHSFAMPIIRYELGDLAEWGAPCDCGITLPVIARMWGRMRHQVRLPSGLRMPMPFFGDELGLFEAIQAFRIVQYRGGELVLFLQVSRPLTDAEQQRIRVIFATNGLGELPLVLVEVDQLAWDTGSKREEFVHTEADWEA